MKLLLLPIIVAVGLGVVSPVAGNPPRSAEEAAVAIAGTAADLEEGKKLYSTYCSSCHGATGRGDGQAAASLSPRPKPLSSVLKSRKEAKVMEIIAQGQGQMPGWKLVLKEEQIQEIYKYMKALERP